jgi:SAM-dependent methyltransferase
MTDTLNLDSWERLYSDSRHISVWPWTDVVSLTLRHAKPRGEEFRVLELGCGAGANIPFFRHLGVEYWGMDGSATTIARLQQAYPDLARRLSVGDFTRALPATGQLDLIIDRGSLTHNDSAGIRRALDLCRQALRPGGFLIAVDLFSADFDEMQNGAAGPDPQTRVHFSGGRLDGTGLAHFADRASVNALFSDFELLSLEHKTVEAVLPATSRYAAWNLVARRPESKAA